MPEDFVNTVALLGQAYTTLGRRIVAGVLEAGFPQRAAHSAVFANIDPAGSRLTTLAARANMTPQAMGELVDDLVGLGYVERTPDPSDRRAKLIVLTERGWASVDAAMRTIAGIERDLDRLLGKETADTVRSALQRILAAEASVPST